MNTYSDNQTGQFYVINATDKVKISNLNGTGKFNVMIADSNNKGIYTTDILDKKLILRKKLNTVKPVYYRKWTVNAPASVADNTTYSLFFYLENMLGFGMQDRWDIVASYTTGTSETVATVMTAIKDDLISKISAANRPANYPKYGPIADDFIVELDGSNNIIVKENPASATYHYNDMDMHTNGTVYEYDLTLSTYDGNAIWGNNARRIMATNDTTVRIAAGMIVRDMEHFFARNRADIYDLTPNFGASIINELRANPGANYILYNIHHAFSDGLGFTYFSEKDLTLAVDTTNTDAITELNKAFNVESGDFTTFGYIYDEASWRANYWRLADYFATEHAAGRTPGNETSWNGDGWLVFNFPAGTYAGKTFGPKYDGDAMATVSMTGTTSFAIYSTTNATDMGSATPVTSSTLNQFDTSKVTITIS